ncbi:MAG: HPr(Ser) kinase/phosphatase [bacterium]
MLHPEVTVGELADALASRGYRLVAGAAARPRPIHQPTIQRVGVALTGYTVHLEHDRVQMMGRAELGYLWSQPPDKRREVLDLLALADFPALVVTTDLEPPPELCQVGDEQPFAVLLTDEPSTVATERVNAHLHRWLAVRSSIHGVLIDVFGVGVLILGKSGIGKSEVALELVAAGHRLVSDDVVILEQESNNVVVGSGPDLTRYHMEIRGLGILNIKDLFGAAAVRERKRVELVCELMEWDPAAHYDRVGLDTQRMELAGVPVTHLTLPVRPGRSLKLIIEVAARDRLLKAQGTHSAQAFAHRLADLLSRGAAPVEITPPAPEETDLE